MPELFFEKNNDKNITIIAGFDGKRMNWCFLTSFKIILIILGYEAIISSLSFHLFPPTINKMGSILQFLIRIKESSLPLLKPIHLIELNTSRDGQLFKNRTKSNNTIFGVLHSRI